MRQLEYVIFIHARLSDPIYCNIVQNNDKNKTLVLKLNFYLSEETLRLIGMAQITFCICQLFQNFSSNGIYSYRRNNLICILKQNFLQRRLKILRHHNCNHIIFYKFILNIWADEVSQC